MEKKWYGIRLDATKRISASDKVISFLNKNNLKPENFVVLNHTDTRVKIAYYAEKSLEE